MKTRELANGIVSNVCETLNIDPPPKMIETLVDIVEKTIQNSCHIDFCEHKNFRISKFGRFTTKFCEDCHLGFEIIENK